MTKTRDPDVVDLERSRRDYQNVLAVHGRASGRDPVKREARTKEIKRIFAVINECQRIGDAAHRPLAETETPIVYPMVFRPYPRPVASPHNGRIFGKRKAP